MDKAKDRSPSVKDIPLEIYEQLHKFLPIPTVDIILVDKGSFLLVKRKNKPAQGQWFFPGGRVLKGEKLEEAALRKIEEEVGLPVTLKEKLGADEQIFSDGPFGNSTHTISIVFLAESKGHRDSVVLDNQGEEYYWFSRIDDSWHPYVKKYLKLAGFSEI